MDEFIRILGIVLSWPVCVLIIAFTFGATFREQISIFIRNISGIRFPGGTEILSQVKKYPAEAKEVGEEVEERESKIRVLSEELESSFEELESSLLDKEKLETLLQLKDAQAAFWEFRYLDLHLVYNTKHVLVWFSRTNAITRAQFHSLWSAPFIQEYSERNAIIEALLSYQLVIEATGFISITDKGRRYIQYAGLENLFPAR